MATDTRLEGVLLDVDGTLVDSNDAHAHAWVDAAREFGFDVGFHKVRPLIGMGGDKLVPRITGLSPEDPRMDRLKDRRTAIFCRTYLRGLRLFPGVRALLRRWRAMDLKLVVATSARGEEAAGLLSIGGLERFMDQATSASDAEHSKPAPDIVCAALERGGLTKENAVMLGDTPYDVEAAQRAGVPLVAVTSGGWDEKALHGAVKIYKDALEVLAAVERDPQGWAR